MKSTIRTGIYIALSAVFAFSCASTPTQKEQPAHSAEQQDEEYDQSASPSELELWAQKAAGSKITVLSSPAETTKGKIFTAPYVVRAEDSEGNLLESFEISVLYPASRENGEIVFAETAVTSDAEGKASFLPPAPACAFNAEISFFPKYDGDAAALGEAEAEQISEIQASRSVKAPFKVQTNLKSAGGVIALVDITQSGKASSNPVSSSNLLMTLMKLGFTRIGNAPVEIMNQVLANNDASIYARARSMLGTSQNFLIYGTVKIDSGEKTDSGFSYTLTASVKSLNMKSGEITFKTQKTVTVTDKNDWNALANARKTISDAIADEIKYGI